MEPHLQLDIFQPQPISDGILRSNEGMSGVYRCQVECMTAEYVKYCMTLGLKKF